MPRRLWRSSKEEKIPRAKRSTAKWHKFPKNCGRRLQARRPTRRKSRMPCCKSSKRRRANVSSVIASGRGLGRAIAQLLAKEGAAVFLTARTEKELSATAAEISSKGGRAAYVAADLTLEAPCSHVVAACREKFGRIDILVNNAGHYGPVVPVEDYPLADFDKLIPLHLRAPSPLPKLALPHMYAHQSGVILNISSLSAQACYSGGSR